MLLRLGTVLPWSIVILLFCVKVSPYSKLITTLTHKYIIVVLLFMCKAICLIRRWQTILLISG